MAAASHAVLTLDEMRRIGVPSSTIHFWANAGVLDRRGPNSYSIRGSEDTWTRALTAAAADIGARGYFAGQTAAQLYGLDGFTGDQVQLLVPYGHRNVSPSAVIHRTRRPIPRADWRFVDGFRVLTPERTILDGSLFGFTKLELERAIDSAVRRRLVSLTRLRARALERRGPGRGGSRKLLDALMDAGGESYLERAFLRLVRRARLPRPDLQMVYRDGHRTIARVDALFGGALVVEVAGHATHATRRQRQVDAQRHTELTLRGLRVLLFTYEDVLERPDWVIAQLRAALTLAPPGLFT